MTKGHVRLHNVTTHGAVRVESTTSVEVSDVHADGGISVVVSHEHQAVGTEVEATPPRVEVTLPEPSSGFFQRKFQRVKSGYLAGVCEGLGEGFGINPLWFRAAFLVLGWYWFSGVLVYLAAAIVLPRREDNPAPPALPEGDEELREAMREVDELTKN